MFTAFHYLDLFSQLFFFQLAAEALHLILAQRYHNLADLLVAGKHAQRVDHDWRPADLKKLLCGRAFFAGWRHACAKTGSGNDDCYLHYCDLIGEKSIATLARLGFFKQQEILNSGSRAWPRS